MRGFRLRRPVRNHGVDMEFGSQQHRPRLASFGARVGAGLIDFLYFLVVSVVVLAGMWFVHALLRPQAEDFTGPTASMAYVEALERTRQLTLILLAPAIFLIAIAVVANVVLLQGISGRSLGKRVVGLRVVRLHGDQPVGIGRTLLRQCAHVLDLLPCYLGYLWPLVDEHRQTFADKVASTVVVVDGYYAAPAGVDVRPASTLSESPPAAPGPTETTLTPTARGSMRPRDLLVASAIGVVLLVVGAVAGVAMLSEDRVPATPLAAPVEIPVEGNTFAMAAAPDGRRIYVVTDGGFAISVLETATDTVSAVIDMPADVGGLVVSADSAYVYANTSKAVVVIDARTSTIRRQFADRSFRLTQGIAVAPDGRRVYAAHTDIAPDSGPGGTFVSVLDTESGTVVASIEFDAQTAIDNLVLAPDGRALYVVRRSVTSVVSVVDTTVDRVVADIPFGQGGLSLFTASGSDGRVLYLSEMLMNQSPASSSGLAVLDLATRAGVGTPWGHPTNIQSVVAAPNGRYVITTSRCCGSRSTTLEVVDVTTRETVYSVDLGGVNDDFFLAVTPDGRRVYAAKQGAGLAVLMVDISPYA